MLDERRTVTFNLEGLLPVFDKQRSQLTVSIPQFTLRGPILNEEKFKEIERELGLTPREIEDGIDRLFEYWEVVSLAKMLLRRRVV